MSPPPAESGDRVSLCIWGLIVYPQLPADWCAACTGYSHGGGSGDPRVLPDVRLHGTSGCLSSLFLEARVWLEIRRKSTWCVGQACRKLCTDARVHTHSAGCVLSSYLSRHQLGVGGEEWVQVCSTR